MKREEVESEQMKLLREAAKVFLKPMEKLPFPIVIEAMTEYQIIPCVEEDDKELLDACCNACMKTVADSKTNPIPANRPNDVSVKVENILQNNLQEFGVVADKPTSKNKTSRTSQGYPDLLLRHNDRPTYLEVKVSMTRNISKGSARNFFYQPVKNSKITQDARHFLCGFSMDEIKEKEWVLNEWTLTDLWFLKVKLKPEYNADNLEIYRPDAVIRKGDDAKITFPK